MKQHKTDYIPFAKIFPKYGSLKKQQQPYAAEKAIMWSQIILCSSKKERVKAAQF